MLIFWTSKVYVLVIRESGLALAAVFGKLIFKYKIKDIEKKCPHFLNPSLIYTMNLNKF